MQHGGGEKGTMQPAVDDQINSTQNNVDEWNNQHHKSLKNGGGRGCFSYVQEEEVEAAVGQKLNLCGPDGGNDTRSIKVSGCCYNSP